MDAPLYMEAAWAAFARMLQDAARTDECYRCPENPAGRIDPLEPDAGLCRACLNEIEQNRRESRDELAEFIRTDDGTDSGRAPYRPGGAW